MIRKTKKITVKSSEYTTPNMKRIVFTSNDLKELSSDQNVYYIKLIVPSVIKSILIKPKVRTYTIRHFDNTTSEMIVDFAIHEPFGPATSWAVEAKVGDQVSIKGPGIKKINTTIDGWYLFAADMSALPAAIAAIENLPKSATGEAFLEVTSQEDIQKMAKPEGLNIHWLIHKEPKKISDKQLESIQKIEIPDSPNIFVAGELNTIKKIKEYLKNNARVINSNNVYISSYWKIGKSDEEHKRAKAFL